MAPLAIRKVIKVVDSPFGIAKLRAMKAGEVLADALIEKGARRKTDLTHRSVVGRTSRLLMSTGPCSTTSVSA